MIIIYILINNANIYNSLLNDFKNQNFEITQSGHLKNIILSVHLKIAFIYRNI